MTRAVLDASALMAFLRDEPGMGRVSEVIEGAAISAVNVAEVVAKGVQYGGTAPEISALLATLPIRMVPFEAEDAYASGALWPVTSKNGLSLGDRSCIALGKRLRLPILTSDGDWKGLENDLGVELVFIR